MLLVAGYQVTLLGHINHTWFVYLQQASSKNTYIPQPGSCLLNSPRLLKDSLRGVKHKDVKRQKIMYHLIGEKTTSTTTATTTNTTITITVKRACSPIAKVQGCFAFVRLVTQMRSVIISRRTELPGKPVWHHLKNVRTWNRIDCNPKDQYGTNQHPSSRTDRRQFYLRSKLRSEGLRSAEWRLEKRKWTRWTERSENTF